MSPEVTVAKRKKAKEDLQTPETRYRRLFESAKDGILILDADTGQVVDANPFLISLHGFSRADLLGKTLWDLLAFGRKQLLQPVPLNLNQVAEWVEKMLRRILGEDIDYVQVLAPDLGVVRADPG